MSKKSPPFVRLMNGFRKNKDTMCWEWQGTKYPNGYGWLKVFGQNTLAHRFSYELHNGPIPDGMEIMHSCDVKHCINPDHLRAGTHQENMKEAQERGRLPAGKDHHWYGKKNPSLRQSNRVLVLGKEYRSQNNAELALGLGSGTVKYWIDNKPEKAMIIEKGELNE